MARGRDSGWGVCVVLLALLVAACTTDDPGASSAIDPGSGLTGTPQQEAGATRTADAGGPLPSGGPFDDEAEVRPDLSVEPAAAAPGGVVEVGFAGGALRGEAFVLERRLEDGWVFTYWLTSAPNGRGTPRWARAAEDWEWIAVDVHGSTPDLLEVPDTAEAGRYRIRTGNSAENIRAELEVREA